MITDLNQELEAMREILAKTEQKLIEKETIFSSILESNLAGYWDWRIQENREFLSPSFKKVLGYSEDELPNHPLSWQRKIHPEDLPKVLLNYEQHVASKGQHPFNNEIRYYHKNGNIVWVLSKGKVIEWDQNGLPVRMVGCHVDITDLKKLQEELLLRTAELENKNKELEHFVFLVTHDLKEPVRVLNSFADQLRIKKSDSLDDQIDSSLNYIQESSRRLNQKIIDLLQYARLGQHDVISCVNCTEIMEQICEELSDLIIESDAQVNYDELPAIEAYPKQLHLLFKNLISNSIKFRRLNIKPCIEISCDFKDECWQFSVQDNGIGFEEKYSQKILMIFQRLHPYHKVEGNGIGLALCNKIIEAHQGKLWVKSDTNQGSTFYFSIPKNLKKAITNQIIQKELRPSL